MFFADKEHLLDYGRPITGDSYVAMEHGPVPTSTRDILKFDSGYPDEYLDILASRVRVEHEGSKQMFFSTEIDAVVQHEVMEPGPRAKLLAGER